MVESFYMVYNMIFYLGLASMICLRILNITSSAVAMFLIPLIVGILGVSMTDTLYSLKVISINKKYSDADLLLKLGFLVVLFYIGSISVTWMCISEIFLFIIDIILVYRLYKQLGKCHLSYKQYLQRLADNKTTKKINSQTTTASVVQFVLLCILINSVNNQIEFAIWASICLIYHCIIMIRSCKNVSCPVKYVVLLWGLEIGIIISAFTKNNLLVWVFYGCYSVRIHELSKDY